MVTTLAVVVAFLSLSHDSGSPSLPHACRKHSQHTPMVHAIQDAHLTSSLEWDRAAVHEAGIPEYEKTPSPPRRAACTCKWRAGACHGTPTPPLLPWVLVGCCPEPQCLAASGVEGVLCPFDPHPGCPESFPFIEAFQSPLLPPRLSLMGRNDGPAGTASPCLSNGERETLPSFPPNTPSSKLTDCDQQRFF